jgi:uncharacterized PurR-regulated membrane protein YhhQ (DUF165 family)
MFKRPQLLFIFLAGFFVSNALIAEFMGVKVFSLEATFGWEPFKFMIGGAERSFDLTAGVLLWPVVFIMTDIVNDYYGVKGVRILSLLSSALIAYGFLMFSLGMEVTPSGFWPTSHIPAGATDAEKLAITSKVADMDYAYRLIFGQGLWIIIGSLTAFLVGQLLDAQVFKAIKKSTGDKGIWLRATGSTLISQFIDSFVVLFVAFYLGGNWTLGMVLSIGLVNYLFKFVVAIALIPVLYLIHGAISAYLGADVAKSMREAAATSSDEQ